MLPFPIRRQLQLLADAETPKMRFEFPVVSAVRRSGELRRFG